VLPLSTQVRGLKPGRSRQDFSGQKNPQHAFLRRGSKAVCPMSSIFGMQKIPKRRGSRHLYKITGTFSPTQFHLSLLQSLVSLQASSHLVAEVGTSKKKGG
jgi:hypothetical protein